jgi:hypothetical protein
MNRPSLTNLILKKCNLPVYEVCGLQGPFLVTVTPLFWGLRAPRTFLGDRYTSFLGFAGSKDLSWRLSHLFFGVCGLQGSFLATVSPLFWGLRAPRTFLGDRYSSFFPFAGSRDLSWRPVHLFFSVFGLQGLFLATGTPLFFRFRAPGIFLGDRYTSFFPFTGSKDLSWRPVHLFFSVFGLQGLFLASGTPLFFCLRAPRIFHCLIWIHLILS